MDFCPEHDRSLQPGEHCPHEPIPGSVYDSTGIWRPTAEQADPGRWGITFPLTARCRNCERRITRQREGEWRTRDNTPRPT